MNQRSKIIITWLLVLGIGIVVLSHERRIQSLKRIFSPPEPVAEVAPMEAPAQYTFEDLLDAIEWVESKGDPWAVGDGGNAVGAYQIHKIYVDDVNRIKGATWTGYQYTYADRYSSPRSRQMVKYYLNHYGGTFEEMARKHNGGPQGIKKIQQKPTGCGSRQEWRK